MRLGIEVGGTFTDLILVADDGSVSATAKSFSTPDDPAQGVLDVIAMLGALPLEGLALVHGSTVATNAVLERKGPKLGFLATAGFKDILELQRQDRDSIYDLHYRKPRPLAGPDACLGVTERVGADGQVIAALDEEGARAAVEKLVELGVGAVAICLLHSYNYPDHERRLRDLVERLRPGLPVSISTEVVAEFREYERASTTTIDAFVKPIVESYVGRLERETSARGFGPVSLMQSNGGLLPVGFVLRRPIQMLFSGPAAGVTAAVRIAGALAIGDLVTLDMGGTSTDVCLVRGGRPSITTDAALDRIPVRVPMVDIVSVGAGGGSVVWVDSGGMLQVGPQSTGALPGPACYGRGGELPTTTDANVVRGLLRPGHFLGGRFRLDPTAAQRALESIARASGRSPSELAEDVFRIANATMAGATREVSVERGQDPRDLTLVAFGGAGPLHAASVAEELNMSRVLVPPYPGLVSAYGLLVADFQRDFSQTEVADLGAVASEQVLGLLDRLQERARSELAAQGVDPEAASSRFAVDMRYRGQGFELTVPISRQELLGGGLEELERRFHDAHLDRYGHSRPGQPVQVVTYRLAVVVPAAQTGLLRAVAEPEREPERLEVLVEGKRTECMFSWRPSLRPGWTTAGPAVIEEDTSTTYVPPGWRAEVDTGTCIVLERAS